MLQRTRQCAGLDVDKARPIRNDRRAVQIAWLLDAHKPLSIHFVRDPLRILAS